jgi:H+/Cl- antiporter ClcA
MEAIRGVVAIEEARRDAELQATIQVVGSALGFVGIVASVAPYLIKQDPPDRKFYFPLSNIEIPSFILVLLISVGAGLGVWMLVWAIAQLKKILPKIKQRLPFR